MVAAKMNNRASCHECEAIAQELGEAYAEAWTSCDQASRDAWVAMYELIGGTEEDVVRAEELISHARFQDLRRLHQTLRRKLAHEGRSGHKIDGADQPSSD
jgi:uncharacterized protein YfkK (UPF0435 family)